MTKRENDAIWAAAEEANRKFGQWMPQLWIEIFIKELASTPPATPAGLGADEIARSVEALKPFAAFCDKHQRMPKTMVITNGSPHAKKQLTMGDCYRAFDALALLSRAGESDQK